MAATNLGKAYITIVPEMKGIQSTISKELSRSGSSSGESWAKSFANSLGLKSGFIAGAISKVTGAAMSAISSAIDGAISRVDTLNTFPKIMKNLGFEAEESSSAVNKLSDRIEGLPTTLDEIVTYTQRLASTTGNLNKGMKNATSIAIAFNDAALAGGKGQIEANRAFEQFVQVISRGRPSMQDWKILMEVMPGQLKQLAKYMYSTNDSLKEYAKNAKKTVDDLDGMDLYEWISADKNASAKERLDDFTTALVELDEKGGDGITSFKDQVSDATHTIGTAMRLIPVRITKALATIVQAFGAGDIYSAIDKFTKSFAGIGDWIAKNIVPIIKNSLIPALKNVLTVAKNIIEFIAANKWVQNFLVGLLGTITAFKAMSAVKNAITGVITPIVNMASNLGTAVSTFKAAHAAGLSFSTSMGAVASSTTGLTSTVAGATGTIGKFVSALGPAGIAGIAGIATLAITGIQAAIIGNEIDTVRATKAVREYERAHYSVKQAVDSAKRAIDLQKQSIQDLKTAEMAATDAEIAAIEARKQATYYQQEMNRLKAEGKQNTDDYRLAELNYTKAIAEEEAANKKLAESQEQVKSTKQEIDDLNSANLYKANLVLGTIMKEKGEYGNLAAQLDALSSSTIRYKDEQGNMVTASKEKAAEMVAGLSEQLAQGNEVWRAIVNKANEEGISFSEACAKYGEQAGSNITGNFSKSVKGNVPLLTEGTKEAAQAAVDAMEKGTGGSYAVGVNLTQGAANGVNDKTALGSLFSRVVANIKNAIAKMRAAAQEHSPSKATAEIGKFLSLGLAKGIDDYADEAIASAKNAATSAVEAFNQNAALDSIQGATQFSTETGLTSGMNGSGGQVIQNNTFNIDNELDVKDVSKRLGWQVATAL